MTLHNTSPSTFRVGTDALVQVTVHFTKPVEIMRGWDGESIAATEVSARLWVDRVLFFGRSEARGFAFRADGTVGKARRTLTSIDLRDLPADVQRVVRAKALAASALLTSDLAVRQADF